jgi:hypothetical protein
MAKSKRKTLFSFYKKIPAEGEGEGQNNLGHQNCLVDENIAADETPPPPKVQRLAANEAPPPPTVQKLNTEASVLTVERDPGLRAQIWDYHPEDQDQVRRIYALLGPYQFVKDKYPYSGPVSHPRCFQSHWFKEFSWLEYSPAKDAAYCFPCYLFSKKPSGRAGSVVFIVNGFKSWKKVKSGKECAFLSHMGSGNKSAHSYNVTCYNNLKNKLAHIDTMMKRQSSEEVKNNRLRLKVTIDTIRWLAFQACAFRGHDESANSTNQGNFLEMVKLLAEYDDEVKAVVLSNAPGNAKYTSPTIQKEVLDIMAAKVQRLICDEIGEAKFCLVVDESRDESRKEQMALVVRFVDKDGFIRERFLDIAHVHDTSSATLKEEICNLLSHHKLDVQNIRGQGYDGASNMRGEWNGLQAKIMAECPYAYYVHCFAHQLQLALVAASKEVPEVQNFFDNLTFVVNSVVSSSKRNDDLISNQIAEMEHLFELGDLETGSGANQVENLKRAGDTRWSSHYDSVCSLLKLYKPTYLVLKDIANTPSNTASIRGKAAGAVRLMMTFEFVFIMHLVKEIMGITDLLCKKLQRKSQDIMNAMDDVATTKQLIQNLRDQGWNKLIADVTSFCSKQGIVVPNMEDLYSDFIRSRSRNETTVEHHYRYDIFTVAIDQQLQELNSRFNEQATELLILCTSLDPNDSFRSFNIENVCLLASKFYPADFTEQERANLRCQLRHYELDVPTNPRFQNLTSVADLCRRLVETKKTDDYHLIDRYFFLLC